MENNKTFARVEDSPNGNPRFVKTTQKDHGFLGGNYVGIPGVASEEEIALMKEKVVEEVCNEIRRIAKEREDFFIIKTGARFPGLDDSIHTTVAAKFVLPTVKYNI